MTRISKYVLAFAFDPLSLNSISHISCIVITCSYSYTRYSLCVPTLVFNQESLLKHINSYFRGIERISSKALHGKFGLTLGYMLCVCKLVLIRHHLSVFHHPHFLGNNGHIKEVQLPIRMIHLDNNFQRLTRVHTKLKIHTLLWIHNLIHPLRIHLSPQIHHPPVGF